MKINLSPQVNDKKLVVTKKGDSLTINGESFNFAQLPEGGLLPATAVASEFIVGDVARVNGELLLTILIPISVDAGEEATFPKPILNPADGKIKFPKGVNE